MGSFIGIYVEGDDPLAANRLFAASKTPFDTWFKDQCKTIFAAGIDFNVPIPPVETLFDYVAEPAYAYAGSSASQSGSASRR